MMYMLISVCDGDIETEIINGLEATQKAMFEAITQIYVDAGKYDRMDEDKGDEWNVWDMSGYVSYDIGGSSTDYKIVELPSYVTNLI